MIRKFFAFLSSNAMALSSLSIAGMGLYLTIPAQREDRAYKELLLRPAISELVTFLGEYFVFNQFPGDTNSC
jgi:hypothetical protein